MDNNQKLLEKFITDHSSDAARLLEQLRIEQISVFIKSISIELSVLLLNETDHYSTLKCIEELEIDQAARIFERLPINTASVILRSMNPDIRQGILEEMNPHISNSLIHKLNQSENTAGAITDPHVPTIPEDFSVKETLERIKKNKGQSYQYIYVINNDRKLMGIVKLEKLISAESTDKITSILDSDVPVLYSDTDVDKVLNHPGWFEYNELPVLDRSGVFLGTINQGLIRKSEKKKKTKTPENAILAGNALGELYRIGLSALFYSTAGQNVDSE